MIWMLIIFSAALKTLSTNCSKRGTPMRHNKKRGLICHQVQFDNFS